MPYFEGAETLKHWRSMAGPVQAGNTGQGQSLYVGPIDIQGEPFPGNILASTLGIGISVTHSTNSTAAFTSTYVAGIYTRNASTLSLINSVSGTWGTAAANASNTGRFNGQRILAILSSQWSSAPWFLEGNRYWLGVMHRTNGFAGPLSYMGVITVSTVAQSGEIGAPTAGTAASHMQFAPMRGVYSVTTAAMPTSIAQSNMTGSGMFAAFTPFVRIDTDFRGYQ